MGISSDMWTFSRPTKALLIQWCEKLHSARHQNYASWWISKAKTCQLASIFTAPTQSLLGPLLHSVSVLFPEGRGLTRESLRAGWPPWRLLDHPVSFGKPMWDGKPWPRLKRSPSQPPQGVSVSSRAGETHPDFVNLLTRYIPDFVFLDDRLLHVGLLFPFEKL